MNINEGNSGNPTTGCIFPKNVKLKISVPFKVMDLCVIITVNLFFTKLWQGREMQPYCTDF